LFLWKFSFSQNLANDSILTTSFNPIFEELIKPDKYTPQDCKDLGDSLAKIDFSKGNKIVLRYYGMFTNGCMTCLYAKYGYKSYFFAPDDIYWENVDAFIASYNQSMLSHLPIEGQNELNILRPRFEPLFTSNLTRHITPNVRRLTDTTLNFRLYSDTLEYLFKEQIDSLKISIHTQFQIRDSVEYNYQEIKKNGVTIRNTKQGILNVYITLDLKNMPNNYDICWCQALEKKYRLVLPIKLE
jgi:hypothetical protein